MFDSFYDKPEDQFRKWTTLIEPTFLGNFSRLVHLWSKIRPFQAQDNSAYVLRGELVLLSLSSSFLELAKDGSCCSDSGDAINFNNREQRFVTLGVV